jgi:hypothetical protein
MAYFLSPKLFESQKEWLFSLHDCIQKVHYNLYLKEK